MFCSLAISAKGASYRSQETARKKGNDVAN